MHKSPERRGSLYREVVEDRYGKKGEPDQRGSWVVRRRKAEQTKRKTNLFRSRENERQTDKLQ